MALATNALTTYAIAKEELGLSDDTQQAYVERLINAASDRIERYCNRSFYNEAARVDALPGTGERLLFVQKTPLNSIASITFDGATVLAADYKIHDAEVGTIFKEAGVWIWTGMVAQVGITDARIPGNEERIYSVTYDGGYVTPEQGAGRDLPYDLEDACVRLVTMRFRKSGRDPSITAERLMEGAATYGGISSSGSKNGMPIEIAAVLDAYAVWGQAL